MGKGDAYRKVNYKAWSEGYDRIFGSKSIETKETKIGVIHPKISDILKEENNNEKNNSCEST